MQQAITCHNEDKSDACQWVAPIADTGSHAEDGHTDTHTNGRHTTRLVKQQKLSPSVHHELAPTSAALGPLQAPSSAGGPMSEPADQRHPHVEKQQEDAPTHRLEKLCQQHKTLWEELNTFKSERDHEKAAKRQRRIVQGQQYRAKVGVIWAQPQRPNTVLCFAPGS